MAKLIWSSKTPFGNKSGLGLTEVVIASLVLGLVALAATQAASFFAKSKLTQTQDLAFLRLIQSTESVISTRSSCDGNLFGRSPNSSGVIDLPGLSVFRPTSSGGANANEIFRISNGSASSFFLNAIEITEIRMQSLGFINSSSAPFEERYRLTIRARKPAGRESFGSSFYFRTFEVPVVVNSTGPGRSIVNCTIPTTSIVNSSANDLPMECANIGGTWDAPNTRCDIRPQVCASLGVTFNTATQQCDSQQLRQAMLAPMLGEFGVCGVAGGAGQNEYLKGFRPDGSPICGPIGPNQTVPINIGRVDPIECRECYIPSVVPCYLQGGATNPRFLVYEGGVTKRALCSANPPGLPRCINKDASFPIYLRGLNCAP
jgi:hypothetical protein